MKRRASLVLVCALLSAVSVLATPATACAAGVLTLAGLGDELAPPPPFYSAVEGNNIVFAVRRAGDVCVGDKPAQVTFATPPDTADEPADYTENTSTRTVPAPTANHQPTQITDSVATADDSDPETVETLRIQLAETEGLGMGIPNDLPAWIIDDDGSERVAFGPLEEFAGREGFPSVKIPVVRQGPLGSSASVDYSITPVTATQGSDYSGISTGTLTYSGGTRIQSIPFTIVNDSIAEPDETLTITLSGPAIEGSTSITYTIRDNEEGTAPRSWFHHPRRGYRYSHGDYRIREVHAFTRDEGSPIASGVARTQMALRQKMTNGSCRWWNGKGFAAGGCAAKRWFAMKLLEPDFYYYRFPKLTPSMGTRVRSYTGFSRAFDKAGNAEVNVIVGRNANTFEIKRS